jgi:hypothetical protein
MWVTPQGFQLLLAPSTHALADGHHPSPRILNQMLTGLTLLCLPARKQPKSSLQISKHSPIKSWRPEFSSCMRAKFIVSRPRGRLLSPRVRDHVRACVLPGLHANSLLLRCVEDSTNFRALRNWRALSARTPGHSTHRSSVRCWRKFPGSPLLMPPRCRHKLTYELGPDVYIV